MLGWILVLNMRDEISLGITKANNKKSSASIIFLKNFIRIPTAVFGSIFVFCTFFSAIFAAWIVPYDPNVMDYNFLLSGMSYEHWLGTCLLYTSDAADE